MKHLLILKNLYITVIIATIGLLSSCSRNETYDFQGDNINRVFIDNQISTNGSGYEVSNASVMHTPVGDTSTVNLKLPVRCSHTAVSEIKVQLEMDTSLVATYNKDHGTKYSAIKSGIVKLVSSVLTIPRGSQISSDSVTVSIPKNKLSLLTDSVYLLRLKIANVSGANDIAVSSNLKTYYIAISTSTTNIINGATLSNMSGSIATPRTGWTISSDAASMSGTSSQVFDGSTSTAWYNSSSSISSVTFTVDLTKVYTGISGFRLYFRYANYGYFAKTVLVSTSSDNSTWNSQGTANLTSTSSYNYICFYNAQNARYIKLTMRGWYSSSYKGLAEFDIYTK